MVKLRVWVRVVCIDGTLAHALLLRCPILCCCFVLLRRPDLVAVA